MSNLPSFPFQQARNVHALGAVERDSGEASGVLALTVDRAHVVGDLRHQFLLVPFEIDAVAHGDEKQVALDERHLGTGLAGGDRLGRVVEGVFTRTGESGHSQGSDPRSDHDDFQKHIIPLPFDYALHSGEEFAQRQASDQTGDFHALPSRYSAYQWDLDDMLALPSEKESLAYLKEADEAREILRERTRQITLDNTKTLQQIAALYALAVIMGVVLAVTSIGAWHKIAEIDRKIALAARR